MNLTHIASNPEILGGKPCIKGTRISIELILEWLASGASINDLIKAYPQLSVESVKEAILYASQYLKNEIIIEVKNAA